MKNYLKIARLDHWIKNIFIIPGVAFAILLVDVTLKPMDIVRFIVGFMSTCFIASSNYVINEWLDAEFDKYHPTKKNRPVVVGNMKLKFVLLEYAIFAIAGLGLAVCINQYFLYAEIWLLVMGILYNVKPIRTKDIIFLDVLSESINNMIRLLLGWFIITDIALPPSSILFGYWMAGAFLMGTKRLAEYRMINNPEVAGLYRKSFKHYTETILCGSSFFYALCSTFSIGIFMLKYRIEYLIAMPIMFGLFSYYFVLIFEEDSVVQKPEKLYREKGLIAIVAVFIVALVILTFVQIPFLHTYRNPFLIDIGK